MTPSLQIDPALVKPPETPPPSESLLTASELEQLAALHERGALTDEEFQAAKASLLGL